jgi:hypothetical protein
LYSDGEEFLFDSLDEGNKQPSSFEEGWASTKAGRTWAGTMLHVPPQKANLSDRPHPGKDRK